VVAAGRSGGAGSGKKRIGRDIEPGGAVDVGRQAILEDVQTSLQTFANGGPKNATGVWSDASPTTAPWEC
jgi:hypothetical protein